MDSGCKCRKPKAAIAIQLEQQILGGVISCRVLQLISIGGIRSKRFQHISAATFAVVDPCAAQRRKCTAGANAMQNSILARPCAPKGSDRGAIVNQIQDTAEGRVGDCRYIRCRSGGAPAADQGGRNQSHPTNHRSSSARWIDGIRRCGQINFVKTREVCEERSWEIGDECRCRRSHPQAESQQWQGACAQHRNADFRQGDPHLPDPMGCGRIWGGSETLLGS